MSLPRIKGALNPRAVNQRAENSGPEQVLVPRKVSRFSLPRRLRTFLRDPAALIGLVIVAGAVIAALAAPVLAHHDPNEVNLENRVSSPSIAFPLGTDHLGRDELSRLLYGARTTLGTASLVLALVMIVSLTVGGLSGYYGGWLDTILMALVDLLLAFPGLILAVAITGTLGPSLINMLIAMAVVWWAGYARLVRGMVLSIRKREFVEAARAIGASDRRILLNHLARNILGPLVVLASLDLGSIILGIAGLNFLGLGAQPPTPEWGAMLNDARPLLQSAPLLLIYPGAAIVLIVLGCNLLGDGLRDILDPNTCRR